MGDGIEHITSNGTPIKVEKVYADMIVFEDKHGKTFAYPVGSTMNSIEFKANEVSEILNGLPKYIRKSYDGFVFAGGPHPIDKYWEVEYNWPGFVGGAYCGRITTIHCKDSLDWLEGMLCHEAGHNMDDAVRFSIRKKNEWEEAKVKDGKYPTEYAERTGSIREDIADSMKLYVRNRTDFKKEFSNRAKLIGELIKLVSKRR